MIKDHYQFYTEPTDNGYGLFVSDVPGRLLSKLTEEEAIKAVADLNENIPQEALWDYAYFTDVKSRSVPHNIYMQRHDKEITKFFQLCLGELRKSLDKNPLTL